MESIICPYCECKVKMRDVDDEGGACPECGAMITGSLLFDQGNQVEEEVEEADVDDTDDDDLDLDEDEDDEDEDE